MDVTVEVLRGDRLPNVDHRLESAREPPLRSDRLPEDSECERSIPGAVKSATVHHPGGGLARL